MKYDIIITELKVEDKIVNSYGIAYIKDGIIVEKVDDISLNQETVEKLADSFNKNDLDPIHFKDVVEDVLEDPDFEG